jgi:hypothetical protein
MVLNLEQLPKAIAEDIEVQSLGLLQGIKEHIVVIGGWGVRAWTQDIASRNTMDVDGVAVEADLRFITRALRKAGMSADAEDDWGMRFHKEYLPSTSAAAEEAEETRGLPEEIELRVEVSEPRIPEKRSPHYFEFDTGKAVIRRISTHRRTASAECRVADLTELAANKVGLPADYKNIFDLALLLDRSSVESIVEVIKSIDDWRDMVVLRVPKIIGRVQREDNTANMLMRAHGVDVGDFVKAVAEIQSSITRSRPPRE